MSTGLAKLAALRAQRDAAPHSAPGIEGEPPTAPVPPTKGRGRRGTTSGSPRGTSGQDNYLDQLTADQAADLARLALALRHGIAATGHTPGEVAKETRYWRLSGICRLDLHQMRRMRMTTLQKICDAAGMPSNAAADMASKAPHAIAPEEAPS